MAHNHTLKNFLDWSAKMAGNPVTFVLALAILMGWLVIGLIWGMSNTWMLILNTVATVNASLMVFVIQNTQYRDSKALHLKIDGLIRVTKEAERELIAIEEMEEDELEKIRMKMSQKEVEKSKKSF